MGTRLAVVYNPVKVADLPALREGVQLRCPGDWDWLETTEDDPGAGQARAALAAGADLVLVCGGDGTVAACAGALAGGPATMAVVPAGTGNLLARNLDLPLDVDEALDVAFGDTERTIDVLESGERRFVVMAGLGFDAALIRDTDDELKARFGWLAYLGGLRRAFARSPRASFTITVDQDEPIRRQAVGVLVGNVGRLQAGIRLLPDAEPDDGQLDVIVLAPRKVADWPVLIGRILRRRAGEGEQADVLRGRRVQIVAEHRLPVEYDGELCGEADTLDVGVLPAALTVRCPGR
jgi:diacylglycerol kinase family enzyme